jgi:two-component system, sensor histidine kinase and response regulator
MSAQPKRKSPGDMASNARRSPDARPPARVSPPLRDGHTVRIREWSFFVVAALMMLSPLAVARVTWRGTEQTHLLIEFAGTLLALFVAAFAFAHFRSNRDNRYLFLGAAFVGVFLLDGYHAVVSSGWFARSVSTSAESMIPWSWTASRVYLAVAMLAGWWIWRRERSGEQTALNGPSICLGLASLVLFMFAIVAFVPLPSGYAAERAAGRPGEFAAGFIFAAALAGYLYGGKWKTEDVEFWIVHSLIIGGITQVFLMPFSFTLYDEMFIAAHAAKLASYACVLTGLLVSMTHVFKRATASAAALAHVNQTLSESNGLVLAILDNTSAVVYVKDLDGRYRLINARYLEIFNLTEAQVIGKTDHDIFPKEAADAFRAMDRSVAEHGIVVEQEERVPQTDGEHIYISTKFPIRGESGDLTAIAGISTDITEIKSAQNAERRAREQLQVILDTAPVVMCMKDRAGRYTLANRHYASEMGFQPGQMIGKTDRELFPDESGIRRHEASMSVMAHREAVQCEETARDMHGRERTFLSHKVPLINDDDEIYGVCNVAADITALKAAQTELVAARDAAQAGERVKADFLANMSHEIRTPMNGVVGMLDLLAESDLSPEQRDYAETARRSAEALIQVINDILDFSKIEAGVMEIEYIDFDVRATVEDVAELFSPLAAGQDIELMTDVSGTVPQTVNGDPGRVRQILLNLIGNALKFTEHGEITIHVSLAEEQGENVTLLFEVEDTGIGIRADQIHRIFDKFNQADMSTTRKYGGTGLGLSISRSLAERMGGQIGVDSNEREGSRFWFTIRVTKCETDYTDPVVAVIPLDPKHILVVDDNQTNRRIVSTELKQFGFTCETAASAAEALDRLRYAAHKGRPFDLALLDRQMPGTDGEELARAIKNDAEIANVALVMLASFGQRGDAARFRDLGFAGYLQKPVKQSQLYECIMAVFGQLDEEQPETKPRLITQHTLKENRRREAVSVLLTEDNLVNQKVAVAMLKKLGHRCDIAHDGAEAVEALRHNSYDLVLMDCQMPVMDGYEAAARIRALPDERKHTPIVAMTAHAMEGDREKCLKAGMDDYLSKPIKIDSLSETISRNLMRRNEDRSFH